MVGSTARTPGQFRRRRVIIGASLMAVGLTGPAGATGTGPAKSAVDTDVLANVLSTAFLAANLSRVCAEQNQWFLEDTKSAAGDGRTFAEHIKEEVLSSLNEGDAGVVVIRAANAARAVSLGLIHVMQDESTAAEEQRMAAWCETTAKPLVRGILAQHDIRHDLYDRMLSRAKQ